MNRLEDLTNRFLDDGLSSEERSELERAIDLDPRGADQLLECYQQDRLLTEMYRPSSAATVDAILTAVLLEDRFVDATMLQASADGVRPGVVQRAGKGDPRRAPGLQPTRRVALEAWFLRFLPKLAWTLALAAAAVVALVIWLLPPVNNQPTLALVPGTQLSIERAARALPAQNGMRLLPGDLLRVSGTNRIMISYGTEPTSLALVGDTELKVVAWDKGKRFELHQGRLEASVARQQPFEPMVLTTPQAVAHVLGTKFSLLTTAEGTRLGVTEGSVRFTRLSDQTSIKVSAGHYALAGSNVLLAPLPLTGTILREFWTNIPGEYFTTFLTSNPSFPNHPSGHEYLDQFEVPSHWGTNYGARIRGYLYPPVTGEYTFWIAAGDGGELWLSPDERPENRQSAGYANGTAVREWTKSPGQHSSSIRLVAGQKYYIEALQKQGAKREDHLAVAWQGPGRQREIISGVFLSPFITAPKKQEP